MSKMAIHPSLIATYLVIQQDEPAPQYAVPACHYVGHDLSSLFCFG